MLDKEEPVPTREARSTLGGVVALALLTAGNLPACADPAKPVDTGANTAVDSGWHPTVEPEWFPNADGVTTTDTSVTDTSDTGGGSSGVIEGCGWEGYGEIHDATTYEWLASDGAAMGGAWDPSTLEVPMAPTEDRSLWEWTGRVPVVWPDGIEPLIQDAEPMYLSPLARRALMPTSHEWGMSEAAVPHEIIPVPTSEGIQYRVARINEPYYSAYNEYGLTYSKPNAQLDVDGDGLLDVLYGAQETVTLRPAMWWSSGPWFGLRGAPATDIERRCGGTLDSTPDIGVFPRFATPIRGGDMDGDGVDDIAGGYVHTFGYEYNFTHATVSPFVFSAASYRESGFEAASSAVLSRPAPYIYGDYPWNQVEWTWAYTWLTPMVTRDVDGDGLAEIAVNGSFFMPDLTTGTMEEVPIVDDAWGMPFFDPLWALEAPVFRPLEEDWNGDGYDDWAILFSDADSRQAAYRYPTSFRVLSGAPLRDDGAIHLSDAWATVRGDMPIHMASVMPHWWTRPDGTAPDVASQPGFVVSSYGVARIFTPSNLPAGSWDMDDVALTLFDGPTLETSGYADAPPWIGGRAVIDDLDEDGRADVVFGATAVDSSYEMRVLYGRTLFEAGAL